MLSLHKMGAKFFRTLHRVNEPLLGNTYQTITEKYTVKRKINGYMVEIVEQIINKS